MHSGGQWPQNLFPVKIWLVLGAAVLWLAGCTYPSAVERDYGCSVSTNKVRQFVDPEAGLYQSTASVGLPPQVGVKVNTMYTDSFKMEEEEHEPTLGIGTE